MKISPINQQNFTGYTNVISSEINTKNVRHLILAMKLNDDVYPDLSNFRKIKSIYQYNPNEINSDIIKISYLETPIVDYGILSVDNIILLNKDSLKSVKESTEGPIAKALYNGVEKAYLTAYSFLADITKRMSKNKAFTKDNSYYDVVFDTAKHVSSDTEPSTFTVNYSIGTEGQKPIKPQLVAKKLYEIFSEQLKIH